jgi:hypothetical protein
MVYVHSKFIPPEQSSLNVFLSLTKYAGLCFVPYRVVMNTTDEYYLSAYLNHIFVAFQITTAY